MNTRPALLRAALIGLSAAMVVPSFARAQTFNFQSEVLGNYAGGQRTITVGGVSAMFSAVGLNMRGLGGFPAGSDRVMSTDSDGQLLTMQLLGGATTNGIAFRNWISGIHTSEVDKIIMSAYDNVGTLLGTASGTSEFMNISAVGISKVTWDDIDATGYVVDEIVLGAVVNTVPEPSTYALMAAGLAMVGFIRRRRRNA